MSRYVAIERVISFPSGAHEEILNLLTNKYNVKISKDEEMDLILIRNPNWRLKRMHYAQDFIENQVLFTDGESGSFTFDKQHCLDELKEYLKTVDYPEQKEELEELYEIVNSLDDNHFYNYEC
jgi:hypothetical protein